jgi:hypothetical protein
MSEPITIREAIETYTETNHPELLAVREEITAIINADSDISFQQIEAGLGQIHHDAEQRGDTTTMQYVMEVYDYAKELYQANDQLTGVAVASTAAMNKAVEDRDELVEAIEEQDEYHPLIGDLIEAVRDQTQYEAEIYAYESAHEDAYDCMANNCRTLLGMEDSGIIRLFSLMVVDGFTGYGVSQIDDETMHIIGKFIEMRLATAIGAGHGG